MKLKDFLENISKMVEENPSILELDVVYARDPEGNGYHPLHYTPSLGHHLDYDEFIHQSDFKEWAEWEECEPLTVNAICIN